MFTSQACTTRDAGSIDIEYAAHVHACGNDTLTIMCANIITRVTATYLHHQKAKWLLENAKFEETAMFCRNA